jgi:hypothetical protein
LKISIAILIQLQTQHVNCFSRFQFEGKRFEVNKHEVSPFCDDFRLVAALGAFSFDMIPL